MAEADAERQEEQPVEEQPVDEQPVEEQPAEEQPADTPTEAEVATPAEPPPAGRSTASILGWVLAGIFAVASVFLAIVAVGLQGDLDARDDDQRDVERAASTFVQAFADYDADDIASLRDDVLPLSAEPFTGQFEAGIEQIQTINETLGRSSQATITDVFVDAVEGDEATAIVVYDSVETFAERDPIPYQNLYLRLGLVRLGGEWRVNDVLNLNFALSDAGGTDQPPASASSSTTVPPTPSG